MPEPGCYAHTKIQILQKIAKTLPPTTAVYEASAAAAQRHGMPIDDVKAYIMKPPDVAIQMEASIFLCKVCNWDQEEGQ